jgi:Mn2+/Fe2+ NRAMP family transporter
MIEKPDTGSASVTGEGEFEAASGPDREFVGATGVRAYARALGPGLITGASDDDPSGIATYAQAGAQSGFGMLWVALLTLPLMMGVQEICDRTALASGKTLGELIAVHFKRGWQIAIGALIAVLVVANALNIAADLVAIGQGMHLLKVGPSALWALVAGALITVLLAAGSFLVIARVFKVLCAALLAYVAVLFLIRIPWQTVAVNTVLPHIKLSSAYIALLVAVRQSPRTCSSGRRCTGSRRCRKRISAATERCRCATAVAARESQSS